MFWRKNRTKEFKEKIDDLNGRIDWKDSIISRHYFEQQEWEAEIENLQRDLRNQEERFSLKYAKISKALHEANDRLNARYL